MKEELEFDEPVLLTLRKSRKAFVLEYACGVFLLLLLLFSYLKDINLSFFVYPVIIFALFSFAYAECSRMFLKYKITSTKLMIFDGLFKQNKKYVYFFSLAYVPDIDIKQNMMERILDYGTIMVSSGANSFQLKEVNSPKIVMEYLEHLIENIRNKRDNKTK